MTAVLITGNPGSGKTTLAGELARRGCAVIDGDDLARWETSSGEPVAPAEPMPDEWLLSHRWVWPPDRLEEVISRAVRPLFVCGIARNQHTLLHLFDRVFLLAIDHRTQIERLDTPANAHRDAAARTQILDGRPTFEAQMRAAGATVLDGRQPTAALAGRILSELNGA